MVWKRRTTRGLATTDVCGGQFSSESRSIVLTCRSSDRTCESSHTEVSRKDRNPILWSNVLDQSDTMSTLRKHATFITMMIAIKIYDKCIGPLDKRVLYPCHIGHKFFPHKINSFPSGYYGEGLNAIIVFSACYLPDSSSPDYHYIMENLFLWVWCAIFEMKSCGHIRQLKLCMSLFCLLSSSRAADPPVQLCRQQSGDARGWRLPDHLHEWSHSPQ